MPSNITIDKDFIDEQLARRQQGYGRGGRMQIETDRVKILSGVRLGKTTGAPVCLEIQNKDWQNWTVPMSVAVSYTHLNNNSVYPLIVRDCGIEVPSKIALTYNQNKKESKEIAKLAARERFLDEYAVSAVWLGGIPLVGKVADYFIKKQGYNPDVNLKLFNKNSVQNIDDNIKNFSTKVSKEIIDELKAVKNNKDVYKRQYLFSPEVLSIALDKRFINTRFI